MWSGWNEYLRGEIMDYSALLMFCAPRFLKSILAAWTNDAPLADGAINIGADYFTKKTDNFLEGRRVERLFADIADRVLSDVGGFIQNEHKRLKPGDVKLIAESCMDIISSRDFVEKCLSLNLDCDLVCDHILKNEFPENIGYSRDDFSSILRFIVGRYISILHALPEFNTRAFGAILRGNDEILDKVSQIHEQISSLDRRATDSVEDVEAQYRKNFIKNNDKIRLIGLDARNISKVYDLSIAYISLKVLDGASDDGKSFEDAISIRADSSKFRILVGSAGSGKTTLLSWLAYNCAKRSFSGDISAYNSLIPVVIRVREFASSELPRSGGIITSQKGVRDSALDQNWVSMQISKGKFLFLIDGLDELVDYRREEVIEWVLDQVRAFPDSHFFVSSRPYAVGSLEDSLRGDGIKFSRMKIEPMDVVQIEKFIERWYDSYSQASLDVDHVDRLERSRERLIHSMQNNGNLRGIAKNPLLCSLFCFVNADREGFVPSARGDIYEIAAETLLERREVERSIKAPDGVQLNKSQKFKILSYVSEYFFRKMKSQLGFDEICGPLSEYLPSLGIDPIMTTKILRHLVERSQILRSPSDGQVDFSHKTFQEFFCAKRFVDLNLKEEISENFFVKEYSEIVLFFCAIAPSRIAGEVMLFAVSGLDSFMSIARKGLKSNNIRSKLIFLYICLTEVSEVDTYLRERIMGRIDLILPPKSLSEADEIALAGGGVISAMAQFTQKKYSKYWHFCAHALIHTFDEEALPLLARFALLEAKDVDVVLVEGKRFFEGVRYNKIVLSRCKTIERIVVKNQSDFDLFLSLPGLREAKISGYNGDLRAGGIKDSVERLEVEGYRGEALSGVVEKFPSVRTLKISDCLASDYGELGKLKKLVRLTISSQYIRDIDFVRSLQNLEELDVEECVSLPERESVYAINHSIRLRSVSVPYMAWFDKIDGRFWKSEDSIEITDVDDDEFGDRFEFEAPDFD